MAIPEFQACMLPFLKVISDGKEYSISEIIDKVSDYFGLSKEERELLLPSGNQAIINNRVGWTRTYLLKAGLIKRTKRAHCAITEEGLKLLESNPDKINIRTLMNYEDFRKWKEATVSGQSIEDEQNRFETPEEAIEKNAKLINDLLADELLEKVKKMSPNFFENLVLELLLKMGYGGALKEAGSLTGSPGDEGIDGIIKEDKLGLDMIYLQAKRWDNVVGRPEIQKFAGALLGKKASKGIFITTSYFSKDAEEYAKSLDKKIVLIDGKKLAELMIEHNIGVNVQKTIEIKKIDSDYFAQED
ncbi:MAG: restriction endonuclease [Candidatus Aminicenantes bacterium]|nr:restriction endonuclease [Candidatus Aminicenantes bacterium]